MGPDPGSLREHDLKMSDRSDRFRKLGTAGKTGNLFEHFGVEVEPPRAAAGTRLPEPVDAVTCPACDWYSVSDTTCEQCGTARAAAET